MIEVTVTHRGKSHKLSLGKTETLASLQDKFDKLTSIPPHLQKLLYKGKKFVDIPLDEDGFPENGYSPSICDVGLKDGTKVTMLGTKPEDLDSMREAVNEKQRVERVMRERALKPSVKLRSTGSSSSSSPSFKYIFHSISPLPATQVSTPPTSEARAYLTRLANDPAIKHIMSIHQFSVGLLTELSLAEYANQGLRGLNENKGEAIKLRIRTDRFDGFRDYNDTRRTLCHELTHNVWGDHDNNFKELNSKLNREVAEFERRVAEGTHRLASGDYYESQSASAFSPNVHVNVLGGGRSGMERVAEALPLTADERRNRVLEATLRRLRIQDEEIEAGCGTSDLPKEDASLQSPADGGKV